MNRRLRIEVMFLLLLVGALMGKQVDALARGDSYKFFDTLVDIHHELSRYYVEEPDQEAMLQGAIGGMLSALKDPHTDYFSPDSLEEFDKQTRGTFFGIGAEIRAENGQILIVTPQEDSPALEAGIQPGDLVLEINGESAANITSTQAVQRITGPEGTQVTLKVRHSDGREETLTITRRRIQIQTVKGFNRRPDKHWNFMLNRTAGVAYVRIEQFSEPTTQDLLAALDQCKAEGMKGLILDLRFNPGGLLEQSVHISDLFLPEGTIVSSSGRNSPKQVWSAKPGDDVGDFPIVVIVNEGSASASEIVAGALKDNKRAVVVGTRTFGKGSVQQMRGLPDNEGAIKVTTALYYLPLGGNLHRREGEADWGVDPTEGYYIPMGLDQVIKMNELRRSNDLINKFTDPNAPAPTPEQIAAELSDPQLAGAYKALLTRLETGGFVPVGQSNAKLQAHLSEKANLEAARDRLTEQLKDLNQRLDSVNKTIAENGATPSDAK